MHKSGNANIERRFTSGILDVWHFADFGAVGMRGKSSYIIAAPTGEHLSNLRR